MARVTVEDCVLKVPNRFDLVMLAAQRARDISSGASLTVERDNDKNPVIALREIADETVPLKKLAESLVTGFQKHVEIDEPEEDAPEFDVPSVPGPVEGEVPADGVAIQADALAVDDPVSESQASEQSDSDVDGEVNSAADIEFESDAEPADSEPADSEPADSEPTESEVAESEAADKEPS